MCMVLGIVERDRNNDLICHYCSGQGLKALYFELTFLKACHGCELIAQPGLHVVLVFSLWLSICKALLFMLFGR